ncbi:MAG: stearoyl-CoA 9-desaturase [Herpetosiphonaceae bacterium]|nr:MAG: stearoyl-CoA 9-desaturase [Herpetosiphonaceae bacterium]
MLMGAHRNRLERVIILISVLAPLVGTVYAIILLWNRLVDWSDLAILFGMYVATGFGITVGYHRMLTHRSFEAHPVIRFVLLALGSMAVQGPAMIWAATHIKHHANTDTEEDPHSPMEGFFHAHVGWILSFRDVSDLEHYGTWLRKDRLVVFMSRTMIVWVALGYVIPYLLGGWSGVLWGGLVRTFLNNHVTWSVNSVCHTFGSRMFNTPDRSTNNWLVGLLAMGEGWHNNHHAFPRSAFHGLRWWQIDGSAYLIRALERLGLIWNVQRIPPERLGRQA